MVAIVSQYEKRVESHGEGSRSKARVGLEQEEDALNYRLYLILSMESLLKKRLVYSETRPFIKIAPRIKERLADSWFAHHNSGSPHRRIPSYLSAVKRDALQLGNK